MIGRKKSKLEAMLVQVLGSARTELSLNEIVDRINKIDPDVFGGKTPKNSLYSIIYKREKKRRDLGVPELLKKKNIGRETFYSLNRNRQKSKGKK